MLYELKVSIHKIITMKIEIFPVLFSAEILEIIYCMSNGKPGTMGLIKIWL